MTHDIIDNRVEKLVDHINRILTTTEAARFAAFVYEQDKKGTALTLDELLVLNALFFERLIDTESAGKLIQKGASESRSVLEHLHERGLVEARGEKRGRAYHMAASLYQRLGCEAAYVRARGFDRIQQRQMVLTALQTAPNGRITRGKVADLCQISKAQAYRLLRKMYDERELDAHGKGRGVYYMLKRTK